MVGLTSVGVTLGDTGEGMLEASVAGAEMAGTEGDAATDVVAKATTGLTSVVTGLTSLVTATAAARDGGTHRLLGARKIAHPRSRAHNAIQVAAVRRRRDGGRLKVVGWRLASAAGTDGWPA